VYRATTLGSRRRRLVRCAAIAIAGEVPLVARPQPVVAFAQAAAEAGLDGSRGGDRDLQAVRMYVLPETGEVDDAEQLARLRVMDRRRRAGPGLDDLDEVLGGEDLHRVIRCQGGPDRVGPGALLAPQGALGEVHRVGRPGANPGVALELQQEASRVAHHDQVVRPAGDARQAVADQRRRLDQGMQLPARRCLGTIGGHRGQSAPRGIHPRVARAPPRVGDRRPDAPVHLARGDEVLPLPPQFARVPAGRRSRVDGEPGIAGHAFPPSRSIGPEG
jgi:hypothetical protein